MTGERMERLDKILEGVGDIRETVGGIQSDVHHGFRRTDDAIARLDGDVRDMRTRLTVLEVAHHEQKGFIGASRTFLALVGAAAGFIGAWLKQKLGF